MWKGIATRLGATSGQPIVRGMLLTAFVGLVFVNLPPVALFSYDLSFLSKFFLAQPSSSFTNVVIVYANLATLGELGTDQGDLSRTNHARLLDRLTQEGARLVFYDFAFAISNQSPRVDETFAAAIKRNGSVILVAPGESVFDRGLLMQRVAAPILPLRSAARDWGHVELYGNVVREISGDFAERNYAASIAARYYTKNGIDSEDRTRARWLNYCGTAGSLPFSTCLFHEALSTGTVPSGYFRDKAVFIGQNYPVTQLGNAKDTFATPYSLFGWPPMPGVDVHATAFLNLVDGNWLVVIPRSGQILAAGVWGATIAFFFFRLSRKPKVALVLVALVAMALVCFVSWVVQWRHHYWWAWIVPSFIQTPVALAWVCLYPRPLESYLAFISHRTDDDGAAALLIRERMERRGYRCFVDVQSLELGRFDEQILGAIEDSAFFVLILSPGCLERCADSNDWIRRELTHALSHGKTVVPVFKDGFTFDDDKDIPDIEPINQLRKYDGLSYSNRNIDGFVNMLDQRFESHRSKRQRERSTKDRRIGG
jgi:CHASE2 domain-containing sensor protein